MKGKTLKSQAPNSGLFNSDSSHSSFPYTSGTQIWLCCQNHLGAFSFRFLSSPQKSPFCRAWEPVIWGEPIIFLKITLRFWHAARSETTPLYHLDFGTQIPFRNKYQLLTRNYYLGSDLYPYLNSRKPWVKFSETQQGKQMGKGHYSSSLIPHSNAN